VSNVYGIVIIVITHAPYIKVQYVQFTMIIAVVVFLLLWQCRCLPISIVM